MAGPIIHLLAAREWAKARPELWECPEFYLGAIAPDAIHMRAGAGKEDKQRTHLHNHSRLDVKPIAEYARARGAAFDLGYVAHVLTDPFWVAAYKTLPGLLKPDGHTNPAVYYPEMENTERALCEDGLFGLLARATPPAGHPLLAADEIAAWRDRVIAHYRALPLGAPDSEIITVPFIEAFVARAGAYLSDMMRRLNP